MIQVNNINKKIMQTHDTNRGKWIEINICVQELILKATKEMIKKINISLKSNAINKTEITNTKKSGIFTY